MALNQSPRSFLSKLPSLAALTSAQLRCFSSVPDDTPLQVDVVPYKTHRIEPPSASVTTTKGELVGFFQQMYKMRRMEIAADMLYKSKAIRGFCHLYDGQEAIVAGMEAALNYNDSVITSYRDHCTHIGRGGTIKQVMSELMGKVDGCSLGLGGSMHMYYKAHNFYGGCGIVGAQVPLGAGLSFKHWYKKEPNVAVTLYGDGAANQGQNFEAMNIAALWKLPTIFVCENNQFGMGTSTTRASKSSDFYTRGDYVPGIKCDGMDALATKRCFAYAKEYAVQNGPIVLEMDTYRYHGHSMSDPGSTYRTRDDVSSIRQERDPIERIRKLLLSNSLMDESTMKAMEKELKKEVDTAVAEAQAAAKPPLDLLYTNIYVAPGDATMRGIDSQTYNTPKYKQHPMALA